MSRQHRKFDRSRVVARTLKSCLLTSLVLWALIWIPSNFARREVRYVNTYTPLITVALLVGLCDCGSSAFDWLFGLLHDCWFTSVYRVCFYTLLLFLSVYYSLHLHFRILSLPFSTSMLYTFPVDFSFNSTLTFRKKTLPVCLPYTFRDSRRFRNNL